MYTPEERLSHYDNDIKVKELKHHSVWMKNNLLHHRFLKREEVFSTIKQHPPPLAVNSKNQHNL